MAIEKNMSAESLAIRTQRRTILTALNQCYDVKLYIESVWLVVLFNEPSAEQTLFKRDILYLEMKGYVKITEGLFMKGCPFLKRFIQLTASGKEIAEETMKDPALEI